MRVSTAPQHSLWRLKFNPSLGFVYLNTQQLSYLLVSFLPKGAHAQLYGECDHTMPVVPVKLTVAFLPPKASWFGHKICGFSTSNPTSHDPRLPTHSHKSSARHSVPQRLFPPLKGILLLFLIFFLLQPNYRRKGGAQCSVAWGGASGN